VTEEIVGTELRDEVAIIRLDDGKANALSPAMIGALHGALDRAEKEAGSALLVGRPGRFSAGFDLSVMRSGAESVRSLVSSGAELLLRLFEFPRPVVVACSGHAIAAGALVLLCGEVRVGVQGEFKIGLSEVGIGMTLPIFAVELARQRLSKRHFTRATALAELYPPDGAVDAGFLDRVTRPEALLEECLAEASRLAKLSQPAFRNTKRSARAAAVAYIRDTLEEDMSKLTGPTSA
jgi:enoyl-CoA hydratase